jgi:phosphatidylethanolamine-binding protein (PEBP) family uncharacterized protein
MAFQLNTAAFPPNGRIPEIYKCEGEDVPPPLVWSGACRHEKLRFDCR